MISSGGTMEGLDLNAFTQDLIRLEPDTQKPSDTVDWKPKMEQFADYIEARYGDDFDFEARYHDLPLKCFANFTFGELCKLKHSSIFCMDDSVDKLFETNPQYEIVRKIESSMWRWGYGRGTWNEIVDAYDNIRKFSIPNPAGFEIRLDHTRYYSPYGYSKYATIYLDGVFAFLVYYKQKHVLTIGFSIQEGRKVLIQQVQAAQKNGNRYLFKLPGNRIEFAIDLFAENFPGYELYVIDGRALINKTLGHYNSALESQKGFLQRFQDSFENQKRILENCRELEVRISHIESRKTKIAKCYRDAGKFKLKTKPLSFNGLKHRQVHIPANA